MAVPFRFDVVLRVREADRDRCRVQLAQEQNVQSVLTAERERVHQARTQILQELTQLQSREQWSAQNALVLHQQAERLEVELLRIEEDLKRAVENVARCLMELTEANTSVLGLEKLAERHKADQSRLELKASERDREDSWRAA